MYNIFKRYSKIAFAYLVLSFISFAMIAIVQASVSAGQEFYAGVSKDAKLLTVSDSHKPIRDFVLEMTQSKGLRTIYKRMPYAEVEAVWTKEKNMHADLLLSGRVFEESDYFSQEKVALVGKERFQKDGEEKNGEKIIYFNAFPYKVIGILGRENGTSAVDDVFFINIGSILGESGLTADGEYIIDSGDSDAHVSYRFLRSKLAGKAGEHPIITLRGLHQYRVSVLSIAEDDRFIRLMAVLVSMVVFSSFAMSIDWVQRREHEIRIRKLWGASDLQVLLYMYTRFFLCALAVFVFALPFCIWQSDWLLASLGYVKAEISVLPALGLYLICVLASFFGALLALVKIRRISLVKGEN